MTQRSPYNMNRIFNNVIIMWRENNYNWMLSTVLDWMASRLAGRAALPFFPLGPHLSLSPPSSPPHNFLSFLPPSSSSFSPLLLFPLYVCMCVCNSFLCVCLICVYSWFLNHNKKKKTTKKKKKKKKKPKKNVCKNCFNLRLVCWFYMYFDSEQRRSCSNWLLIDSY